MTAEEIVEYLFADGVTIKEAIEAITTYGLQKQNEVLDKAAEGISNIQFEEYQHEMSEGWDIDLYAGVAIGRKYSRLSR